VSMVASRPSVVVPSYRRPEELRRCLAGLTSQSLRPAETIVVRRAGDRATEAVLSQFRDSAVAQVIVTEPGVLAAMSSGAAAASGDVVAFIDDDAVPRPDWLERLTRHFDELDVGGVGGRDIIVNGAAPESQTLDVGRLTWWGKLIGNHHRGAGEARDVMVLKAACMAFRRNALALPRGLRGSGAQVHFEVGMSLSALRRGWRLVYDPSAVVEHYVAQRFDADRRERPEPVAVRDAAYNLVTCLLDQAPEFFWRRALYGVIVGDRDIPGLARAAVALLRDERDVLRRVGPALEGQAAALRQAYGRRRKLPVEDRSRSSPRTRRPRVALLAHDVHDEGGMERACLELLERASDDVDFVVISARLAPSVRSRVRWRRLPIPQRPFPLKFSAYYLLAGLRLAAERVDLVHTLGAVVPNRVDLASVHFCHAGFQASGADESMPASALRRLNTRVSRRLALTTERWSYRQDRVRRLAAVSSGVARELNTFYPGVDTTLTLNGVDHDRFRPDEDTYRRIRSRAGVARGTCVALFVGGDWHRKGLGVAIGGLAQARAQGMPVVLWVVGPGDRTRFRALAARAGVEEQVRFFGRCTGVERFYQAADVFVMPTSYETFCLAAFEAAAAGLPLVVTETHGVSDLVGDDTAGVRVERTPEAVGMGLVRLASNPNIRASLGAAARSRSLEFTWQRSVEAVLASYTALMESATDGATVPKRS
jgi:glycosyltransferase involved in cell wall biosynthesis/GT2 family glycosyltransferase